MSYWNIETNSFMPQGLSVGEYVPLADSEKIESIILKQKNKFLCIMMMNIPKISAMKLILFAKYLRINFLKNLNLKSKGELN